MKKMFDNCKPTGYPVLVDAKSSTRAWQLGNLRRTQPPFLTRLADFFCPLCNVAPSIWAALRWKPSGLPVSLGTGLPTSVMSALFAFGSAAGREIFFSTQGASK
jgi:hypothetical protein